VNTQNFLELDLVFSEFKQCTQLQYNGRLSITSQKGYEWNFYYRLGQIVWATGGIHPHRRLRRHLAQTCPKIDLSAIKLLPENISLDYWDYRLLESFFSQQLIKGEQINDIVVDVVTEILFDVVQQASCESLNCERNSEVILSAPFVSTCAFMSVKYAQELWSNWLDLKLTNASPNLAPRLLKPEQLREKVSPDVYKRLENLINGDYTLWDLAARMKHSVLSVTRSLLSYIHQGIIELVEVPDLPLAVVKDVNKVAQQKYHIAPQIKRKNSPLVACVDDSLQMCQILEQVVLSRGMNYISIKDSVEALGILIEHKPDLIFLDLIMPVVNGFEICAQLRRVSSFSDTPLIILTGSDGTFDKVRSKVFGATEFITKPIDPDKIVKVIDKYLSNIPMAMNQTNLAFAY